MARRDGPAVPLRVVDDAQPVTLESQLAALFAQEAALTRQLGDVRRAIYAQRQAICARDGLLMLPRYELLRQRLAPQPQGEPA